MNDTLVSDAVRITVQNGRSHKHLILDLVNDGIQSKITHLTGESRRKLGSALGRIVNEGSDGLICILV